MNIGTPDYRKNLLEALQAVRADAHADYSTGIQYGLVLGMTWVVDYHVGQRVIELASNAAEYARRDRLAARQARNAA